MNIRFFFRIVVLLIFYRGVFSSRIVVGAELYLKEDTSKKCAICHYQWVPTFYLEHRSTPIARADEKWLETFSWEMCISCHDSSVQRFPKKNM